MAVDILFPLRRFHGYLHDKTEHYKWKRRIKSYHNLYKGQRCFIVGNGPSLNSNDLNKLYENSEITFGMNRIYKFFDNTKWRPTFYVCEDPLIAKSQKEQIENLQVKEIFLPFDLKFRHNIDVTNALYFNLNYHQNKRMPFNFSDNLLQQLECRGTVTCTCMQIAIYMGFSQIYLIGVDHNYYKTIDIDGNVVIDPTVRDYFCDDYDNDIINEVVHNMGDNTRAYIDAKSYCDFHKKNTIYNSTRGGKLEVFERVDFDSLFI